MFQNITQSTDSQQNPFVMIAILVRNKAFILPWFLGHLERLNYPKSRITLWIRSDHNEDSSSAILKQWVSAVRERYNDIDLLTDDSLTDYEEATGPCAWTKQRFDRVIALRQEALETARRAGMDYIFMLDADVILENRNTLKALISSKRTVVGPMLKSSEGDAYSNFWGAMTDMGFYKRSVDYFQILDREKKGVFKCAMVHTAVLIDLRKPVTKRFSYSHRPKSFNGPTDDIIIFAQNVKNAGKKMYILNTEYFGIVMNPLEDDGTLHDEEDRFITIRSDAMVNNRALYRSVHLEEESEPTLDMMGFDQIYIINLKRRPERRTRMLNMLKNHGVKAKVTEAVDGQTLNTTYLKNLGVRMLPGYVDPHWGRELTLGEVGCFLSHYFIWKDIMDNNHRRVIIFEDDARLDPSFRRRTLQMMEEAEKEVPDWDLIYLGRKQMTNDKEERVPGTTSLLWPSYSYWQLAYVLSNRGARKLIDQKPLRKMIPVDEYIPVMIDHHPKDSWNINFSPRNLRAMSIEPLVAYPTHYKGDQNYISDTEFSFLIPSDLNSQEKNEDFYTRTADISHAKDEF
ncbi:hypothetical protein FSP39_001417 [Pinctada imbricata]|uniref:Glycosyl transferase family 25 domain-containing protein n=1 Tax=Pinctada imbricata TaxID=66713 RepID=A0AA88XML0_PINIB|nr:hypothetical protein FSP39_001417 [Pinctada imbricata]